MSCEEICRRAKSYGCDSIAVTDRDNLYGLWSFLRCCREYGLRPVIGAEVSDRSSGTIATCLVKTEEGFRNLCRLLTERHCSDTFCLCDGLARYCHGLIQLSDDRILLEKLLGLGVQAIADLGPRPTAVAEKLRAWAARNGLRSTVTCDCAMAVAGDKRLFALLRAIDENSSLSDTEARCEDGSWFEPPEEIAGRFAIWPDAVRESWRIGEACVFSGPSTEVIMPPWSGGDALKMLRQTAYKGARYRYGDDLGEEVVDRLEYELKIIEKMGFSSYFLVVRDIVHPKGEDGRRHRRRICGRGSGAASLVAYCLGITNVCPLQYNLYFERFLHPGRKDPPDIDIDFSWDERDGVIAEVLHRHVGQSAMVSSHILFQPRMAIRETAKAYGLPEYEISAVTKKIPMNVGRNGDLFADLCENPALRGQHLGGPWREIVDLASRLVGMPRHLSVHPGGVVITGDALKDHVPIQYTAKGVPVIQWDKGGAEDAGFVKIDLLGNRSLGVIRDCLADVAGNGVAFDERGWMPEDDVETKRAVACGRTMGCFYIESPAMRLLQQKAKSGSYEQLVIQSSIIRPAANEFVREYVRRLHGGSWQSLHERLDDILKETYGLMVYQEDVSKVAVHLAGMSHVRADGLRKVMSKKDKTRRLADYREEFFSGCARQGVGNEVADELWRMMMSFSGYSFCKPHSASYAKVSFQAAFLKTHFPAEFMAAVISNHGGYYSAFAYVSEARRLGVRILPPDVNDSLLRWRGKNAEIRVGLEAVRGVSEKLKCRLVLAREKAGAFRSVEEFFRRVQPDSDEGAALVHAGALDCLGGGKNRTQLLWELSRLCRQREGAGGSALFPVKLPPIPKLPAPAIRDMYRREYAVLGFLCSIHPLRLLEKLPQERVMATEISHHRGRRIVIAGWLITGKIVSTKTGDTMEFLTFEDESGVVETTFFPQVYARYASLLTSGRPYLLQGVVDCDFGVDTITVERVWAVKKES